MKKPTSSNKNPLCPTCGKPMQRLPALDSTEYVAVCRTCTSGPTSFDTDPSGASIEDAKSHSTARDMSMQDRSDAAPPSNQQAEEVPEDPPKEVRDSMIEEEPTTSSKPAEELSEDIAASLRDQGYVISQDVHGVRISGDLSSSRGDTGPMSPYDIIRIAADLDGGVLPTEQRRHCQKCEAVVPIGDSRCQWCGEPMTPESESSDQD